MACTDWGFNEVADWLTTLGLEEFAPTFIEQRINGYRMLKLTEQMIALLVPIMGDRIQFQEELEKLKELPKENSTCGEERIPLSAGSEDNIRDASSHSDRQEPEASEAGPTSSSSTSVVWHDLQDYKLPVFPPLVKVLLQTQRNSLDYMPGTSNRRSVLDVITGDLQKQGLMTPSRKGYSSILNGLFKEYPFLGDPRCWRQSLRNKMKLLRMPLTTSSFLELKAKFGGPGRPQGQKRKSEDESIKDQDVLLKRLKPQNHVAEEEDEDALKTHIVLLQQEMRKATPDLSLCQRKMERTLAYRNRKKYDPTVSVADILSEFPTLRRRNFLASEAKSENIGRAGEDAWNKLHSSLVYLMKFSKQRCRNFKLYYSKYLEDLDSTLNEEQRKEHGLLFAMKLIPSLFREDEDMVLVDNIEMIKSPFPILVCKEDGFQLFINGEPVLIRKTAKFSSAFETLFHSYWVFAVQYPKELKNTMLFIEKYLFELVSKIPATVSSWGKKMGME